MESFKNITDKNIVQIITYREIFVVVVCFEVFCLFLRNVSVLTTVRTGKIRNSVLTMEKLILDWIISDTNLKWIQI